MPRSVRLTDAAADDLEAVRAWQLQRGSGLAARNRVRAILTAIRQLAEMPYRHAEGDNPGTRAFSVAGHRIVYSVDQDPGAVSAVDVVVVLRIYGPGQSRQ